MNEYNKYLSVSVQTLLGSILLYFIFLASISAFDHHIGFGQSSIYANDVVVRISQTIFIDLFYIALFLIALLASLVFFLFRSHFKNIFLNIILGGIVLLLFSGSICTSGGWISGGSCGLPFDGILGIFDIFFWLLIASFGVFFAFLIDKLINIVSPKILIIITVVLFIVTLLATSYQHRSLSEQSLKDDSIKTQYVEGLRRDLAGYYDIHQSYPTSLDPKNFPSPEYLYDYADFTYAVSKDYQGFVIATRVALIPGDSATSDRIKKGLHGLVLGVDCGDHSYCLGQTSPMHYSSE